MFAPQRARIPMLFAIALPCLFGAKAASWPNEVGTEMVATPMLRCPQCRIRLVQVATLQGSGDSVYLDERGPVARDRDGNYVVWTSEPGRIAKYDQFGRLMAVFGRSGAGPGEIGASFGPLLPLPDGRLIIFEPGAISVFGSDLKFQARRRQPVRVMGNPVAISAHKIVVPGFVASPEANGYPLHVIDITDGTVMSLGAVDQERGNRTCPACITRHLSQVDSQGGIWVARHRSYQLEHWKTRQPARMAVLKPAVPWFPGSLGNALESGDAVANPTIPVVRALWRDSSDRLFVLGGAVADGRVQRQRATERRAISPSPTREGVRRKEILDVIDARTGIRLSTLEIAAPPYYKSLGNGYLAITEDDDEGDVRVRVFKVEFSR